MAELSCVDCAKTKFEVNNIFENGIVLICCKCERCHYVKDNTIYITNASGKHYLSSQEELWFDDTGRIRRVDRKNDRVATYDCDDRIGAIKDFNLVRQIL